MSKAKDIAVEDFYDIEHRVNGFWNSVLFKFFKPETIAPSGTGPFQSTFYISPEVYPKPKDTSGVRADLVVSKMVYNEETHGAIFTTVLAYEGKGANGDTLTQARSQQEDWFKKAGLKGSSPVCYCITTRGPFVKFYIWEPKYGPSTLTPIWWDRTKGKLLKGDVGGDAPVPTTNTDHAYDTCVAMDVQDINQILTQIKTNVGEPDQTDNGDVPKS
ncbi:hypothetical protein VTN00DRAFT_9572 [Thermoascus crustaceus]|uniref:uncharacterized protein n=1 Tax=Thermoascus crustaceus TaxID=5088 RepID=UPI0037424A1F